MKHESHESAKEEAGSAHPEEIHLAKKVSLEEAGTAIRMNLIIQLCLGAAALVLFIILRKKMPWMYCANSKQSTNHPAYSYTGLFNWIWPVFSISDSDLFALIGFDAFLFVETLKLLGIVFFILSALLFPLLGGYYAYFGGSEMEQMFMRLSLLSTPERKRSANAVLPGVAAWVVTLIIMYFLYMFYRRYIIMRQLHLRDRMFSKSIPSIRRLVNELSSTQEALDEIDLPSRSVLLYNLPDSVNSRHSLTNYLKYLSLGVEPIDCYVVNNAKALEKYTRQRMEVIYLLEREIQCLFLAMNALSITNRSIWQEIEGYNTEIDLISNAIAWEQQRRQEKRSTPTAQETQELVMRFFSSSFIETLAEYSRKIDPEKTRTHLATIHELNQIIERERIHAQSIDEKKRDGVFWKGDTLYDPYVIEKEQPLFFSLRSLLQAPSTYKDFVRSLPKKTHCGFITLSSAETANALRASLIGTGSFSCKATEAPAPREVMWNVLCDSEMHRMLRKLISSVITLIFIVFFALFVFFVSTLINIKTFNEIVKWINPELLSITDSVSFRKSFQAIILPSLYTFFLGLAPAALNAVCLFEGSNSQVGLQRNFGRKYSVFLFVNGFLALIFGTTVISLLIENKKESKSIFEMISGPVTSSSVFFFNILIQKTLSASIISLIEPRRIFARVCMNLLGGVKTRREEIEEIQPEKINFGYLYPQVFLMFPMVLIYTVICPVFFLFGTMYFFGQFAKYKVLFIYSHVSDLESGGSHWPLLCRSIFYSLITFQLVNIAHFVSLGEYVILFFIVPLLILTYGAFRSFHGIMQKRCNYLPSNSKELEESARFMYRILEARKEEIKQWKESAAVKKEVLNLSKSFKKSFSSYPYRDLALFPASCSATLPRWFCTTLQYLKEKGGPTYTL